MSWHADTDLIERYAEGDLTESAASSIEAHLLTCPTCRSIVADTTSGKAGSADALDRIWQATLEQVDRPRRSWFERVATVIGVPDHTARLIGVTPTLRLSWLAAVALVCGVAAAVSRSDAGLYPFFLVAPLVPLAAVAAAYAAPFDAGHDLAVASPTGALRLLLYRVLAVCIASFTILTVATLGLDHVGPMSVAWVLPAIAMTCLLLALGVRHDPVLVAMGLAASWFVGVWTVGLLGSLASPSGEFVATTQVVAVIVAGASIAFFTAHRHLVGLPTR